MKNYRSLSFVLLIAQAILGLNVHAEIDDSYVYQMTVAPKGNSSLQRVELTNDFYWLDIENELNNILVVDAKGQAMPFEISQINSIKTEAYLQELKLYPLFEDQYLREQTENISLIYNENQQLQKIEKTQSSESNQMIVGYILDLNINDSKNNTRQNNWMKNPELEFELSKTDSTSFIHFNIDQSNDLKHWSRLSSNEVLAQLYHQTELSLHNKIQLNSSKSRYLRLSVTDQQPAFEILSAKLKYSNQQSQQKLLWQTVQFKKDQKTNELIVELPASIAVKQLKFDLTKNHPILKGKLSYLHESHDRKRHHFKKQNHQQIQWLNYSSFNLYQIKDGENEIIKNSIELNGLNTNSLKLQLDYPILANNQTQLTAQIAWQAQSLIFLNAGESPYTIVAGHIENSNDKNQVVMQSNKQNQIFSEIKQNIKTPIEDATVISSKINQHNIKNDEATINWQKIFLWLLMFVGVALMFWMAKGLLMQAGKDKHKKMEKN